jgi:DNA-binding NarL/FixJ family response regulator
MSQWGVQLVIGKLMTDEGFRECLEGRGRECLTSLCKRGIDLTESEITVLVEGDPRVWSQMATQIDRRLRTIGVTPVTAEQNAQRPLTGREEHVLRGIFEGLTNKQIAADLGVSESAVKATLQHVFRKTQVRTRAQLVRIAIEGSLGATQRRR